MARKSSSTKTNNSSLVVKLIILGVLIFTLGTISQFQVFYNSLKTAQEAHIEAPSGQAPTGIEIPSINLKTEIVQGGFVNGDWVLSDTEALYLPTSGKIGEGYNTIIYAHNTAQLFGSMKGVNIGDAITITDNEGKTFNYSIFSKENIDPQDLKKLYSTEKDIVTLFTCDGWFDQERLLVKARLVN